MMTGSRQKDGYSEGNEGVVSEDEEDDFPGWYSEQMDTESLQLMYSVLHSQDLLEDEDDSMSNECSSECKCKQGEWSSDVSNGCSSSHSFPETSYPICEDVQDRKRNFGFFTEDCNAFVDAEGGVQVGGIVVKVKDEKAGDEQVAEGDNEDDFECFVVMEKVAHDGEKKPEVTGRVVQTQATAQETCKVPKEKAVAVCDRYGSVKGIEVGKVYDSVESLEPDGIHVPNSTGLHIGEKGVYSVVLSGADMVEDNGSCFTYTVEEHCIKSEPRDTNESWGLLEEPEDAKPSRNTLALIASYKGQRHVRVIRSHTLRSNYAPETGFRYDGVYVVKEYYTTSGGLSGKIPYKFLFERMGRQKPIPYRDLADEPDEQVGRSYSLRQKTENPSVIGSEEELSARPLTPRYSTRRTHPGTGRAQEDDKKDLKNMVNDLLQLSDVAENKVNGLISSVNRREKRIKRPCLYVDEDNSSPLGSHPMQKSFASERAHASSSTSYAPKLSRTGHLHKAPRRNYMQTSPTTDPLQETPSERYDQKPFSRNVSESDHSQKTLSRDYCRASSTSDSNCPYSSRGSGFLRISDGSEFAQQTFSGSRIQKSARKIQKPKVSEDHSWRTPVHRSSGSNRHSYGPIEGIEIGSVWVSRHDLSRDKVHCPINVTAHNGPDGIYSVLLSGLCGNVVDNGEEFVYTAEENAYDRQLNEKPTVPRSVFTLRRSIKSGRPVRVVRESKLQSDYAPTDGYRYDGLYTVEKGWQTSEESSFTKYKFLLKRCKGQAPAPWQGVTHAKIMYPEERAAPIFIDPLRLVSANRARSSTSQGVNESEDPLRHSTDEIYPTEESDDDDDDNNTAARVRPYEGRWKKTDFVNCLSMIHQINNSSAPNQDGQLLLPESDRALLGDEFPSTEQSKIEHADTDQAGTTTDGTKEELSAISCESKRRIVRGKGKRVKHKRKYVPDKRSCSLFGNPTNILYSVTERKLSKSKVLNGSYVSSTYITRRDSCDSSSSCDSDIFNPSQRGNVSSGSPPEKLIFGGMSRRPVERSVVQRNGRRDNSKYSQGAYNLREKRVQRRYTDYVYAELSDFAEDGESNMCVRTCSCKRDKKYKNVPYIKGAGFLTGAEKEFYDRVCKEDPLEGTSWMHTHSKGH